ncbi:PfkB family carbohydrate kinase [Microbacterium sp. NPDC019599]|uniref:1-phosphofructokinase family hexose kinase n=1 Tax=Microbacterium sp. NPDC019599 TaxID=3154690 RepID=UPI0033EC6EC4
MERPAVIVALALSPSLDVTYEVDRLELGGITRPRTVTRVAGGKALNLARAARQLGAHVSAVAALGGPTGAWIADLLESDGVPTTVVGLASTTRSCFAIAEEHGAGSSTDVYEPATPLSEDEWEAFARGAAEVARRAEPGAWVALSGSLPSGAGPDDVAGLLAKLRSMGCRIAVDGSGAGLRATAPHADLLKINRAEAADVLGEEFADAASAARALHERWGVDAVVTDGVRGGFALLRAAEFTVAPPASPGRFSAGSGDAFLGGLLTGLDRGDSPADALDLARSAAERNAACPGQGVLAPL